ncbi:RNase H domain-containing protein [Trichonephila clavipes]|nr:RNase H domain-containing protein [Trichonephila clavipes]
MGLTQEINSLLFSIGTLGKSCTLQWIPAHVDIEGNEMADSLANEPRTLEPVTSSVMVFDANAYARLRFYEKAVSPKCLGGPPVDRDRLNAHSGQTGTQENRNRKLFKLKPPADYRSRNHGQRVRSSTPSIIEDHLVEGMMHAKSVEAQSPPVGVTAKVVLENACRRQIYRPISKRNRRTTAQQVANQFLAASGKQISRKTVARRLRGGGLYARRPFVCVALTRQHRTARLQWCREHPIGLNRTEHAYYSPMSRFSLSSECRRQLIWRESGTAYHPENIQERTDIRHAIS